MRFYAEQRAYPIQAGALRKSPTKTTSLRDLANALSSLLITKLSLKVLELC